MDILWQVLGWIDRLAAIVGYVVMVVVAVVVLAIKLQNKGTKV